jgi:hypothetical protein
MGPSRISSFEKPRLSAIVLLMLLTIPLVSTLRYITGAFS